MVVSIIGGSLAGVAARLFGIMVAGAIILFVLYLFGKEIGFFSTERGQAILDTMLIMNELWERKEDE